jgi:hypothetical protein
MMRVTIGLIDPSGRHLISGDDRNLHRVLRHVPSIEHSPVGAWVRHEDVEQATELLRAAGYAVATPGRVRVAPARRKLRIVEPLSEWTAEDQARSHEGWRLATRALGNDPDLIEASRG